MDVHIPQSDNDSAARRVSFKGPGGYAGDKAMFGVRPWPLPTSETYRKKYEDLDVIETVPIQRNDNLCSIGNVLWVVLFGWWVAIPFLITGTLLMLTWVAREYGRVCFRFAIYLFWPFGKCVIQLAQDSDILLSEHNSLIPASEWKNKSVGGKVGFLLYVLISSVTLFPVLIVSVMINWFFVVSIPMAKVLWTIFELLVSQPTNVTILPDYNQAARHTVLLCNWRAFNVLYFEYEVKGVNIVFLNLIPVVVARALMIVIHMFYEFHFLDTIPQFFIDLLCSIPITFYIGTSIASIAAQTNYTIGAILNASFGSITELLLFTFAIRKGALNDLILYSLTGSLLCDMLLLPGLSMIIGGLKYHEQKFNPTAASVSSLLLFVAVIGAFTPTIWYQVFGATSTDCTSCVFEYPNDTYNGTRMVCFDCSFGRLGIDNDPAAKSLKNLMYLATAILPTTYLIGMFFTFKTHKHIFDDEGEEEGSAEWSIPFSFFVMFVSITCFGLLAEDVVTLLEEVLKDLGLTQAFLGITLIALTPAATEIANAIKFALLNQISLSVSIGSASSIQVALIQMPALIILSIIFAGDGAGSFHLIFPLMSVFSVILAVLTFNYISADGHSNYFVGTVLVVMYILFIASFYFTPPPDPFPGFLENRTTNFPINPPPPPPPPHW